MFGIANEEDNKETVNYPQFSNLVYQANNSSNLVFFPYNYNYNYYYVMNNNGTQQNSNSPPQIQSFI